MAMAVPGVCVEKIVSLLANYTKNIFSHIK